MMTGNMAETCLQQNEGQGLHARLVGLLVTSFLFKKHITYFFLVVFIAVSNTSSSFLHLKHGALRSKYMSSGIEQ